MESMQWPSESVSTTGQVGARTLPEDLRRAASGETPFSQAFQTIARYEEDLVHAAKELREREIWAASVILDASGVIWHRLARPTLRFELGTPQEPAPYHIELGLFPHLAALTTPSADEQALIAATMPCWARVGPHLERQGSGQMGPLACSYVCLTVAEAVDALGLENILARLGAATCDVARDLIAEVQAHRERYDRLQQVERMLGWDPEAAGAPGDGASPRRRHTVGVLVAFVLYVWRSITRSGH